MLREINLAFFIFFDFGILFLLVLLLLLLSLCFTAFRHFLRSFRARSVNLSTPVLGKPPWQFTST